MVILARAHLIQVIVLKKNVPQTSSPCAQKIQREQEFWLYLNMAIWSVMPPLRHSICPVSNVRPIYLLYVKD